MTDRELLELAAKAAGYKVLCYVENYDDYYWHGATTGLQIEGINGVWNPLTDDGDALRLAVKLRQCVDMDCWEAVVISDCELPSNYIENPVTEPMKDNDHFAAVRRAIVRAAAEIGKGL